jgi:hypothetical protein
MKSLLSDGCAQGFLDEAGQGNEFSRRSSTDGLLVFEFFCELNQAFELFNRDTEEIAENRCGAGSTSQTIDASAACPAFSRHVFSNLRRGARVGCVTRAPLRTFLTKSA